MKELSIEEKAKAYDGLIERLKDLKFACRFSPLSDTIDEIFPELAESVDECIRKSIIHLVKKSNEQGGYALHKDEADKMIAWLEKQGEQPQGKSALEAAQEEKVDNANKVELRQEELTEFEKAVKQVMEEAIECGDTHNLKADADMLLSLVQKPAWSEEDEKKMESIIGSIRFNSFMNNTLAPIYELDIRWLKSLKDRVQPQQEKERILGKLEEWLDEYISNLADVGTDTLIGSFRKYLDGKLPVKSLSQWKPSDEQMDALNDVISSRDIKYDVLSELWKDLEKLLKI